MIEKGQKVPDFTLPNQDGDMVSLSDFRGKPVAVYFYPKDNTPGCTREACSFRDNWSSLEAAGVAVVGISGDPVEKHRAFSRKLGLPFPILSDPELKVIRAYEAYGAKNMYGKRIEGILRTTYVLDADGTVIKVFKRPKSAIHAEEVLVALKNHAR